MKVNVVIKSVSNEPGSHRATGNIVFDEAFIIRNVRLFIGRKPYISMPSTRNRSGRRFNPFHPVTAEFNNELTSIFTQAYNEFLVDKGLTAAEDDASDTQLSFITEQSNGEDEDDDEVPAPEQAEDDWK